MNKLSGILFPPQMRPELAKHIAVHLCWEPPHSDAVNFTSLVILFASWQATEPATLQDLQDILSTTFANETDLPLTSMALKLFFEARAVSQKVSHLTKAHATQAARHWSRQLKKSDIPQLRKQFDETICQIDEDTSARATEIAAELEHAIRALHSENREQRQPVYILGPNGVQAGPFASEEEAIAHFKKQMDAFESKFKESLVSVAQAKDPKTSLDGDGAGYPIFNPEDAVSALQLQAPVIPGMPTEGNAQQRRLLEAMANGTGKRKMSMVPHGSPLAELYEGFPHFKEVLDFIAKRLALAACGDEGSPLRLPPLLLRGVPGTGKSYFAQELARVLGAKFERRDLSATTAAWTISGMDSSWRGSKQGLVFDAIVNGETANPVICLDEVDKVAKTGEHNSPLSPMYALLEPATANCYKDEFVPVALDTSRVNWVLTANDGDIPDPILSRVKSFQIPQPTKEQCRVIAASVWKAIRTRSMPKGHGFSDRLSESLLDVLSAMPPRDMQHLLTDAAATAAINARKCIAVDDLTEAQKENGKTPAKREIGFLAQHQAA